MADTVIIIMELVCANVLLVILEPFVRPFSVAMLVDQLLVLMEVFVSLQLVFVLVSLVIQELHVQHVR